MTSQSERNKKSRSAKVGVSTFLDLEYLEIWEICKSHFQGSPKKVIQGFLDALKVANGEKLAKVNWKDLGGEIKQLQSEILRLKTELLRLRRETENLYSQEELDAAVSEVKSEKDKEIRRLKLDLAIARKEEIDPDELTFEEARYVYISTMGLGSFSDEPDEIDKAIEKLGGF